MTFESCNCKKYFSTLKAVVMTCNKINLTSIWLNFMQIYKSDAKTLEVIFKHVQHENSWDAWKNLWDDN